MANKVTINMVRAIAKDYHNQAMVWFRIAHLRYEAHTLCPKNDYLFKGWLAAGHRAMDCCAKADHWHKVLLDITK